MPDYLFGLTLAQAAACGVNVRATVIDGVPQIVTMDFDPTRVNVTVTDGVITAIGRNG